MPADKPGLVERLEQGPVICAEGYLFECERRGYLQAGAFVPEVVLEHPEVVLQLHREFVHAGSDVVQAFTYYAHREKLRVIGREGQLEELNRRALDLAREVADESGTFLAGNISNTNVFLPEESETHRKAREMFDEQIAWADEAGVDFVIGETFSWAAEAVMAVEAIRDAGLPAVLTMSIHRDAMTMDGLSPADACRRLEAAGADVVGLNCGRGPATMLPLLGPIREAVSCHVAALPVPYRTREDQPTFQTLRDPELDEMPFPTALDPFTCNRHEMAEFGKAALELGVRYLGVCCGAGPHHIRSLAEALGRTPPASRYSADMSKHAFFGTDPAIRQQYREFARDL
jgi:betaine-homocysteine S-methyltransferase